MKNLANFEKLISFCTSLGAKYKPSKPAHQLAQMSEKLTRSNTMHNDLGNAKIILDNAKISRKIFFDQFPGLASSVVNAFDASDATPEAVKDAKLWRNRIRGIRSTAIPEKTTAADGTVTDPKVISTSQRGFNKIIEHFTNLIGVVRMDSNYQPLETGLAVTGLDQTLATAISLNSSVTNSETNYDLKEVYRDKEMYDRKTGLVTVAKDIKLYLRSILGYNSPEYKKISALEFRYYDGK